MSKLRGAHYALVLAALALSAPAMAATVLDTRPGNYSVAPFGNPDTATYGQTVTVPAVDHFLNNFTLQLDRGSSEIQFAGYVAAWDGAKASGSILYESAMQTLGTGSGLAEFTFNTGSLNLTAGAQYVLFISASKFIDGGNVGTTSMQVRSDNPYSDGQFVFFNNGADFGAITTTPWDNFLGDQYDAAFAATFSANASATAAVPLPSAACSAAAVMAGMGLRRRR